MLSVAVNRYCWTAFPSFGTSILTVSMLVANLTLAKQKIFKLKVSICHPIRSGLMSSICWLSIMVVPCNVFQKNFSGYYI
ncbi:hypothetical protein V1525DRAFT_401077 [Lipomyces kononenkoae]|uniref:Uncharacterized protein n=1 Tax=Lipomyces kononenkoae TaxID=34357 RepID=A0ACC3T4G1_LIPKO